MIEVERQTILNVNCKDLHVRIWAHDYPSRKRDLETIRQQIQAELVKHVPKGTSWYVWVLLAPTSYGSDTED